MKSFSQFLNEKDESPEKPRFRGRKADRIKNATGGKKTGSLRAGNISFPGDRSGAYKATKSDIETRKGFSKNKPGGLKADETNKFVKTSVRKGRVDDLGGDIYNQPKFSQKKFDKSIKSLSKGPKTNITDPFGKGDTKGQMNIKAMDKKSFKVTQPKDVKLPKSFRDFSQKLQDFKDRDIPGGPKKTTTKPKTSSTSLTRQDVGMAPPDKPKVVKQSEISKQAKSSNVIDFNKFKKEAEAAKNKFRIEADKIAKNPNLTRGEKAKQAKPVMRNVKTAQNFERGYKSNPTTAVVRSKDLETVQSAGKPTGSQLFNQNKITGATGPKSAKDVKLPDFTSNRVDLRKVKDSKTEIDFGSKTINPKDTPRARAERPYSGGPTNYPKRGQVSKALGMSKETRSSWKTRAKVKQFGVASGAYGAVKKYKQERAKGKSKISSGIAAGLKGTARFAGTYGGAMLAKKFGGKTAAMGITGLIGGSIGDRGYDVTSKTVNRVKNLFSPEKKSNNPPKVPPKKPIDQYTQDQKPRYDISKIIKRRSSKN